MRSSCHRDYRPSGPSVLARRSASLPGLRLLASYLYDDFLKVIASSSSNSDFEDTRLEGSDDQTHGHV
jgi:hypothetical protein